MKKTLFSFILILQFWSLQANSYYCKQISVENGLSQSSVTDVIYDGRGALWIGTRFGLNEYRNGKLRVFMDDGSNRIMGNYIYLLHNDAQGDLWVSTDKGLFRYDSSSDSFSRISENQVTCAVNTESGIWFGAHFGLSFYSYGNDTFTEWASDIYTDYQALYLYRGKLLSLDKKEGPALGYGEETERMDVKELTDGRMIMASALEGDVLYMSILNYGVIGYSLTEKQTVFTLMHGEKGLPREPLLAMLVIDDSLWMGFDGASVQALNLKDYSIKTIERQPEQAGGHIPLSVTKLYRDPLGNVWIGSVRSGLVGLKRSPIRTFDLTHSKPSVENVIIDIFPSRDGNIYLGTDGSGVGRYIPQTGITLSSSMEDMKVTSVADYDDDYLIIATYNHGFFTMDRKTSAIRPFIIIDRETNQVECYSSNAPTLYNLEDGNILFLTVHTYIYNMRTRQFIQLEDLTEEKGTELLAIGPANGTFYAYSSAGLFTIDLQARTLSLIYEPDIQTGSINTAVFHGGLIWFGTNYGLFSFDPRSQHVSKTESGLFSRVSRLESNRSDNLWIAADNTLFLSRNGRIEMTGENRGVPANEILSSACLPNGTVYLGGTAGLIEIGADCYFDMGENKVVQLRDVSSRTLKLPYNYSSLVIRVDLAGADPYEKNLFRFHLSGTSEISTDTFDDSISLPALKSGHYKLDVSYLRSDGTWSLPQQISSLHILRPWYASDVMILIYVIFGLGLIIFIIDRVSRKRVKAMEERLRARDIEFTNKFEKYLDEHLADSQLTVEKIAKEMALSRASLYYKMNSVYGKGVAEIVEDKRMAKAEELLRSSSLSVLDISEKVGYSTSRYFSTRFKQTHNGLTPLKYRQMNR